MTVHVEELTSEVIASGGAPPAAPATESRLPWEAEAAHRLLCERVARDAARTQAEDYRD